jgi:hypothetical protein
VLHKEATEGKRLQQFAPQVSGRALNWVLLAWDLLCPETPGGQRYYGELAMQARLIFGR